jgi:hypothetical protein
MSDVTAPQPPEPGDGLVARLQQLAESQRNRRGNYLYRGDADPWLEEAAARIQALEQELSEARDVIAKLRDTSKASPVGGGDGNTFIISMPGAAALTSAAALNRGGAFLQRTKP